MVSREIKTTDWNRIIHQYKMQRWQNHVIPSENISLAIFCCLTCCDWEMLSAYVSFFFVRIVIVVDLPKQSRNWNIQMPQTHSRCDFLSFSVFPSLTIGFMFLRIAHRFCLFVSAQGNGNLHGKMDSNIPWDAIIVFIAINTYWMFTRAISRDFFFPFCNHPLSLCISKCYTLKFIGFQSLFNLPFSFFGNVSKEKKKH